MSSFYHGDPPDRMAEFKAIVTASFDDIGSHVALEGVSRPSRLVPPVPPSSTDKRTRRSPISFLRKVKSHASSILCPHPKLDPPPPRSFVPSPPVPRRAPTPIPFANSLPRNCLSRASGRSLHASDVPDSEPKSSFFDDDDKDENVDKRLSPTRRISSAPARSNSRRLSSAFAAAPALFGLSSHAVSTPYLAAEKNDVVRPEIKPGLAHVCTHFASTSTLSSHIFDLPAVIQIVSETQASYKVLPPKDDIISLPSLFTINRSFPSYAIVSSSPILNCFRRP